MTKRTEQNIVNLVTFNVGGQKLKKTATPEMVASLTSETSIIALQEVSSKKWTLNFCENLAKDSENWYCDYQSFTSSDHIAFAWRSDIWSWDSPGSLSNIGKYCSYPMTHLKTKQVINFIVVHLPLKRKLMTRIDLLRQFLAEMHEKHEKYVILGDFNLSPESMQPVLPKRTRMTINTSIVITTPKGNSIDNFISNMNLTLSGPKRIDISDHYPVGATFLI